MSAGLTRADYVRLVATVQTISKAIPMRIIPGVELRVKNRKMEGRLVGTTPDYAEVTRLAVRWAPISVAAGGSHAGQDLFPFDPTNGPGYVQHCHILDHEDNEFMRPMLITR